MAGAVIYHGNSSSFRNIFQHQVFLSFQGADVRKKFIDHLYDALTGSGLKVFRDNDGLEHGQDIQLKLFQAIERSQLSIVTLSCKYADSRWCLDELVKIMDRRSTHGHTVLPVFYDVEPTHVRNQSGPYEEAFKAHEVRFTGEIGRVNNWKSALKQVADLKGMASTDVDGYESRFVQNIVNEVRKMVDQRLLHVSPYIVGTNSIVTRISNWLQDGSQCVELGEIYGLGGIGKTTIAKIAYNNNLHKFDGGSFLAVFDGLSMQGNGVPLLLEQLMADISGKTPHKVYNIHKGIEDVIAVLRSKRILLVLDNLDSRIQIHLLLPITSSLHPGSKVIITTRNSVLGNSASLKCHVHPLSHDEATSVFCQNAFGKNVPSEDFKSIVDSFVKYCGGLPLALEVLGSSLCNLKELQHWQSQLDKLERFPKREIVDILMLSYDSLEDDNDKDIFLHVAFFLVGMKKDKAIRILESCDLHPKIGLENLNNRSLVTVDFNERLTMHHLVQEMGKYVVREEVPREPGKRSRLWCPEEAFRVLRNNEGTLSIKGICLEFPMPLTQRLKRSSSLAFGKSTAPSIARNSRSVRTDAFTNMKNLNLLQINNILLEGCFKDFPKAIKWLRWNGCTLESLPSEFDLNEVVVLEMCNSMLVHSWQSGKFVGVLSVLNLSHSHKLVDTPDFSSTPMIEWMSFEDCISLNKIHESIGGLTKLTYLNISGCINLKWLPGAIYNLHTLEVLNLSGSPCFPKDRNISGSLRLSQTTPFSSLNIFRSLRELSLRNCGIQDDIFYYLKGCSSLKVLDLGDNPITTISEGLGCLTRLIRLMLNGCGKLRSISKLPLAVKLFCQICPSLERIAYDYGVPMYSDYCFVNATDCPKLTEIEGYYKFEATEDMNVERARYMGFSGMESLDGGHPGLRGGVYSLREGIYSAVVKGDHIARWFTTVGTIKNEERFYSTFFYTVPLLPNCPIRAFNVGSVFVIEKVLSSMREDVCISNMTRHWKYTFRPLFINVDYLNECEMTFLTHWSVVKGRDLRPGDELQVQFDELGGKYGGFQIIYEDEVVEVEAKDGNSEYTMETVESHGCSISSNNNSCSGENVNNTTGSESEKDTRENNNNASATPVWYNNTFLAVDLCKERWASYEPVWEKYRTNHHFWIR